MKIWVIILMMALTACGNDVDVDPSEPTSTPKPEVTNPGGNEKQSPSDDTKLEVKGEPEQMVEDEADEPFTAWVDPVTDREWLIVGAGDAVDAVCDPGYEVPDIFDLQQAEANGLADEFEAREMDTRIWTKNLNDGEVESWRDLSDTTQWQNTLVDGFVLCVEES